MIVRRMVGIAALVVAMPAVAQVRSAQSTTSVVDSQDDEESIVQQQQQQRTQTLLDTNQNGRTARSSVGQAGQRQTREAAAEQAGIKPMARIASRIQNRVQNRIRNRIDRNYDPQANATDPFAVAEDQARSGSRPR